MKFQFHFVTRQVRRSHGGLLPKTDDVSVPKDLFVLRRIINFIPFCSRRRTVFSIHEIVAAITA